MLYAGIDEVGVSSIAGPVVAAVVILPEQHGIEELPIDSKRLNDMQIKQLAEKIKEKAIFYKIVELSEEKIEEFTVEFCVVKLLNKLSKTIRSKYKNIKIIVDGKRKIPRIRNDKNHEAIIGADSKYDNVSAAAIIAKEYCDSKLLELDKVYPGYNFKKNKGYPVAEHIEAIKKLGYCGAHRSSMAKQEFDKNKDKALEISKTNINSKLLKECIMLLSFLYKKDNKLFSDFQRDFCFKNYRKIVNEEENISAKVQYWTSKILLDVSEKYCKINNLKINRREFFGNIKVIDEKSFIQIKNIIL